MGDVRVEKTLRIVCSYYPIRFVSEEDQLALTGLLGAGLVRLTEDGFAVPSQRGLERLTEIDGSRLLYVSENGPGQEV